MPKALKAGFPTYWTQFGQGAREMLAIHCSLADSGSWGGLARYLSGACTITAFDMPGHGRSAAWNARGEVQGVTTAIAAEFLSGPMDVIGHSFGATVALRLAVEHPELVRSLVLVEPVIFAVALRDDPEMRVTFKATMAAFDTAMQNADHFAAAREFVRIWGGGAEWEAVPLEQQQELANQMGMVAAGRNALYDDVGGVLNAGRLERVQQPVLLVEGSKSPGIVSAIQEGLSRRLPQAKRTVIMGAGHMVPLTHPAQVSSEILRFLRANAHQP